MSVNKRAYAYIFRNYNDERQLLVFKEAGPGKYFQLPGGGVDPGETPEQGVVREIEEESGLTGLQPIHFIGSSVETYDHIVYQKHFFKVEVTTALPDHWAHLVTGTGGDAGLTYYYQWINYESAFSLHTNFHGFFHTEYFEDFFPDPKQIGASSDAVLLQPYSKYWPIFFEAERDIILAAAGQSIRDIHHIGSTAVPGLAARPTIDMAISYREQSDIEAITEQLLKLGYLHHGPAGIAGRQLFTKKKGVRNHFQAHVFHHHSIHLERQLEFTKALTSNQYFEKVFVKNKLAALSRHQSNPDRYQKEMSLFFNDYFKREETDKVPLPNI